MSHFPLKDRITVSVKDATAITGLSRSRLYQLLYDGRIRSVNVGRRRLIHVSSLKELLGEVAHGNVLPEHGEGGRQGLTKDGSQTS